MTMRAAVVEESSGKVDNVIVLNPDVEFMPAKGFRLVPSEDASIGDTIREDGTLAKGAPIPAPLPPATPTSDLLTRLELLMSGGVISKPDNVQKVVEEIVRWAQELRDQGYLK